MENNFNMLAEMYPEVKPIRTREELTLVQSHAKYDCHDVNAPTHYVEKNGEVVGCFNVGPIVLWWMDSKKSKIRDSIFVLGVMETLLRTAGIGQYTLFCGSSSPYMAYMERVGFVKGNQFTFFKKGI